MRYDGKCAICGIVEFDKGMHDPWPAECPECGCGSFVRVYQPTIVRYNAPGFTQYDDYLKKSVKPEQWHRFEKERERIKREDGHISLEES